jgi:hypothetical protein
MSHFRQEIRLRARTNCIADTCQSSLCRANKHRVLNIMVSRNNENPIAEASCDRVKSSRHPAVAIAVVIAVFDAVFSTTQMSSSGTGVEF